MTTNNSFRFLFFSGKHPTPTPPLKWEGSGCAVVFLPRTVTDEHCLCNMGALGSSGLAILMH